MRDRRVHAIECSRHRSVHATERSYYYYYYYYYYYDYYYYYYDC